MFLPVVLRDTVTVYQKLLAENREMLLYIRELGGGDSV